MMFIPDQNLKTGYTMLKAYDNELDFSLGPFIQDWREDLSWKALPHMS